MTLDCNAGAATVLAVIFVLTCAALLVGSWGSYRILSVNIAGLEPWKAVLIWVGDVTTFCWFVRFFVQHVLHAEPLRARPWQQFKRDREWMFALGSLLLGASLDAAVTLWIKHDDETSFDRGVVVQAEVMELHRTYPNSGDYHFEMLCATRTATAPTTKSAS